MAGEVPGGEGTKNTTNNYYTTNNINYYCEDPEQTPEPSLEPSPTPTQAPQPSLEPSATPVATQKPDDGYNVTAGNKPYYVPPTSKPTKAPAPAKTPAPTKAPVVTDDSKLLQPEFNPTKISGSLSFLGAFEAGQTLKVDLSLVEADGKLAIEWKKNGVRIATGTTYHLSSRDIGTSITVEATAVGQEGKLSANTRMIKGGILKGTASISGAKSGGNKVGDTLTATVKDVSAGANLNRGIWSINGTQVGRGNKYTIKSGDEGKKIKYTVDATHFSGKITAETKAISIYKEPIATPSPTRSPSSGGGSSSGGGGTVTPPTTDPGTPPVTPPGTPGGPQGNPDPGNQQPQAGDSSTIDAPTGGSAPSISNEQPSAPAESMQSEPVQSAPAAAPQGAPSNENSQPTVSAMLNDIRGGNAAKPAPNVAKTMNL